MILTILLIKAKTFSNEEQKMRRTLKKTVVLILVISMLTGICCPAVSAEDACGYVPAMKMEELKKSGEAAIAGEAYSIQNEDDLTALAEYCNAGGTTAGVTFYLKRDIKIDKRNFYPIGTEQSPFSGCFDGCGFVIENLNVNAEGDAALFGTVSGEIQNLCVLGTVSGNNAGGIAVNLSGRIANCMSNVSVNGRGICGGIAAIVTDGRIENCVFSGKCMNGGGLANELCGSSYAGNCYYAYYSAGSAFQSTDDECTTDVHRFASSPTMCVAENEITLGSYTGEDITELLNAWIGLQTDGTVYREWYFDTRSDAMERIGGRYPSQVYPDYAFPEEIRYTANASMTTLYEMDEDAQEGAFYSISDALELSYLAAFVNAGHSTKGATFFLTADMSIIASDSHYKGDSWIPIGSSGTNSFKGVFDGQGYVITELLMNDVISSDCPEYAGLFGYVNSSDAIIKNVAVSGEISDGKYAGGIVAELMAGTVENSWFAGDISAEDAAGGIAGEMAGGSLVNCAYFGTASSDKSCGGVAGNTEKAAEIKFCYFSNDNSSAAGSGNGKTYLALGFSKTNGEYILSRSVSITGTSTIRLLNALNQWVENISMDETMRAWKHDTSPLSVSRIRGDHPTQIYLGEGKKAQYAAETPMETEQKENPYNVSYHTTATMTELYDSGEDAVSGGNYSISTGDEMWLLSMYVEEGHSTKDANFYLTTDIYLTNQGTEHTGAGWVPIGTGVSIDYEISSISRFCGDFDGCGFTVYGLYVVSDFLDFAGLFGRCKGSTIKNLGVCGEILGDDEVGGIAGRLEDGEIINCWSSVTIQASTEVGGIAGHIVDSRVENCSNYGFIVTTLDEGESSGGIVGSSFGDCQITNCYYLYNGSDALGNSLSKNTEVTDVLYFHYDISGDKNCTLEHAISVGELVSDDLLTVLNAWVYAQNSDQYCSWHKAVSIQEIPGAAGQYPVLLNSTVVPSPGDPDYCGDYVADATVSELYSTRSDGEAGCCYSISDTDDLLAFRKYVNDGYKTEGLVFFLTRDIDLSRTYSADTGQSWTPIGTSKNPFKGIFDGQGYTVKYLYIQRTSEDDQGLFGNVSGLKSVIKNLGVTGEVLSMGKNIAAICGNFNFGTIANCWTACEVEGSSVVGGIIGSGNIGKILNCSNYGLVIASSSYGAIAGFPVNTEISNCYYLYASCQVPYQKGSMPNASNVTYFNGVGAACILHETVYVEGEQSKNLSIALNLYVDAHPEVNYCYWDIAKSEEYAMMGVGEYPVLVSASNTMGGLDYKNTVAVFAGNDYYSMLKAVQAANAAEGGGTVEMVQNSLLDKFQNATLDDDVSISTGDYSLIIKSKLYIKSLSQLNGMFTVKEGGSVYLWNDEAGKYMLFMYSNKNADISCNSEFYGTDSLTFFSSPVEDNPEAYNITLYSGEFMVNSTLDSGNPHIIPGGSTLTVKENAALNVLPNARIRTSGGAEIYDYGTIKIGNAVLDRNTGCRIKGVLEDDGGMVTLPYIYKDGYTFKGWADESTVYPPGSIAEVSSPKTLTAKWMIGSSDDPYPGDDCYSEDRPVYNIPITVIQSDGGTITPDSLYAAKGENISLHITPDSQHTVRTVLVDGHPVELDSNGSYTIVSVSRAHNVVALFAEVSNSAYYSWSSPFEDVSDSEWYYDNVRYCASTGWFAGTAENTFSPENAMTREMLAMALWRMAGCPVVPSGAGQDFSDVPKTSYAYEAIHWAAMFDIINGYGDGSFGYGDMLLREQLAAIVFRYAKNYVCVDISAYDSTNILGYTDALQISFGMAQPLQWAVGAGIILGTSDTTLEPRGMATRAQVAAVLSRFSDKFVAQRSVLR